MLHSCKSSHDAILSHVGFDSDTRRLFRDQRSETREQTGERGVGGYMYLRVKVEWEGESCVFIYWPVELFMSSGPDRGE